MSGAAPAKAQKTERSDTPHRGRFDNKSKGHNKRGHHDKVAAPRRRRLAFSLKSRHASRTFAPCPAQGNQNNAASARRSIDACAQARGDTAVQRTNRADGCAMPALALQRGDIEGALALFRRAKAEVMRLISRSRLAD